jgi:hypothetical protein
MDTSHFAVLILLAKYAARAIPASSETKEIISLTRTRRNHVRGAAYFRTLNGEGRFTVGIENVMPGTALDIVIGGLTRATVTTDENGIAVADFRTGIIAGRQQPLDFDPRGMTIEIKDDSGAILVGSGLAENEAWW